MFWLGVELRSALYWATGLESRHDLPPIERVVKKAKVKVQKRFAPLDFEIQGKGNAPI